MTSSIGRLLLLGTIVVLGGCDGRITEKRASGEHRANPAPGTSPVGAPPASATSVPLDAMFVTNGPFRFRDFTLPEDMRERLTKAFAPLNPRDLVAKRVESVTGEPIPVRVLVLSFQIPEGLTLAHVAFEVGRDFLGATPENSVPALRGRGIYMEPATEGASEALAFFVTPDTFVYAYGTSRAAPTEEVSKMILLNAEGK